MRPHSPMEAIRSNYNGNEARFLNDFVNYEPDKLSDDNSVTFWQAIDQKGLTGLTKEAACLLALDWLFRRFRPHCLAFPVGGKSQWPVKAGLGK